MPGGGKQVSRARYERRRTAVRIAPEVVMFALAGRWFFMCRMLGNIARSICSFTRSDLISSHDTPPDALDCTDLVDRLRASVCLDPKPEHREHHAADDAEVAEPKPEGRPVEHGEADVQARADCPVQHHYN